MILVSDYTLERKKNSNDFYVRTRERPSCPCCAGRMKLIGNRPRKVIRQDGSLFRIIIRRFRCEVCGRVHHELPDILVPYKRYTADAIEKFLIFSEKEEGHGDQMPEDYPCEYSTVLRLRTWLRGLIDLLNNMATDFSRQIIRTMRIRALSISELVDSSPGWVKKLVLSIYRRREFFSLYP